MAISSCRCSPWLNLPTRVCGAMAEPDPRQRRLRRRAQFVVAAGLAPEPERMAAMRLHRERDIVERGEIGEQRGDLERPRETKPAAADGPAAA